MLHECCYGSQSAIDWSICEKPCSTADGHCGQKQQGVTALTGQDGPGQIDPGPFRQWSVLLDQSRTSLTFSSNFTSSTRSDTQPYVGRSRYEHMSWLSKRAAPPRALLEQGKSAIIRLTKDNPPCTSIPRKLSLRPLSRKTVQQHCMAARLHGPITVARCAVCRTSCSRPWSPVPAHIAARWPRDCSDFVRPL